MKIECLVEREMSSERVPCGIRSTSACYWTDINGFKIDRYSVKTHEVKSWRFDLPVSALSLTSDADWLVVALGPYLILWSPATDKRIPFAQPERHWRFNRLDDGATDPSGTFWVGSMRNNVAEGGSDLVVEGLTGSLYRVKADGEVKVADTGFGITNTLVWSLDHSTFYCGCSIRNRIYAYDYDAEGPTVSNRRVFVQDLAPGVPDGSPVSDITNCGFGGSELQTLYVTTASLHAGKDEVLAGGLFRDYHKRARHGARAVSFAGFYACATRWNLNKFQNFHLPLA